jgi:hypothetical protein
MEAIAANGQPVTLAISGHLWVSNKCYIPGIEPDGVFPVRPTATDDPGSRLDAAEINHRYGHASLAENDLLRRFDRTFRA